jgi:trans-aconitate methyltransferase
MTHAEMVALLRDGVAVPGGTWADLGAGSGNFTRALRQLVGPQAVIYAVDRDAAALQGQTDALVVRADFTQPLDLPPLDGILMANALHWIRQPAPLLVRLANRLRPAGSLLLVEYAVDAPRSYVPFPVPYARFETLAQAAGFTAVRQVGARRSPSSGITMYAAVAQKAASVEVRN